MLGKTLVQKVSGEINKDSRFVHITLYYPLFPATHKTQTHTHSVYTRTQTHRVPPSLHLINGWEKCYLFVVLRKQIIPHDLMIPSLGS